MQREEGNRRSAFSSRNETPEKFVKTLEDDDTGRREKKMETEQKSRMQYTPRFSPDKYRSTPQSSGSSRREGRPRQEDNKRKAQFKAYSESPEKIRKTPQSGRFVNALIGQWAKHTGMQIPLTPGGNENLVTEEVKKECPNQARKIQILQKKLQEAEETISELTEAQEAEMRVKEEILGKLNANWESIEIITKYSNDISESLVGFQQHHANLSTMYSNVITAQQSNLQKLRDELKDLKSKDEEQSKLYSELETKYIDQENRLKETTAVQEELKKELELVENKFLLEKKRLESFHAEERLKLIKEQEELSSRNEQLQLQLKELEKEKGSVSELFTDKAMEISKLQEELERCKNQIEDLLRRNGELTEKYEKSVEKGDELSEQLESKLEELRRLGENLESRQEIESSLAKDLDLIRDRLTSTERKLNEKQAQNQDLQSLMEETKTKDERRIAELNEKIESLENHMKEVLLEEREKVQNVDKSYKSLQEKHEKELSTIRREYETRLSELRETIASKNAAFTKLGGTLEKANTENQSLRERFEQMKEYNEKLQSKLKERSEALAEKTVVETELRDASRTWESRFKDVEHKLKSMQVELENTPKMIDSIDRMLHKEQENIVINLTEKNSESKKIATPLASILKQQKNIRFDLNSPPKTFDHKENVYHLSQGKSPSQGRTISEPRSQDNTIEEIRDTQSDRKFFKTRGSVVRKYGSQRKSNKK